MKYALLFDVGDSRLAMDVKRVSHVLRKPDVTPLPGAPAYIEGVLIYQEKVVPVLRLAEKFDLTPSEGPGRVFLVTLDDMLVGFRVDRIRDVVDVGDTDPATGDTGIPLTGVLKLDGEPVGILNPDLLLTETDRRILHALH